MKRDIRIDLLRTIGICLIILAHSNPPNVIFQIRNFDVSLMVILSGYLYSKLEKTEFSFEYVFKRFKRLIIPVWIFLIIFFIGIFIINKKIITLNLLISSFTLYDGIGYIWIIRIYFIIAILGGIFDKIIKRKKIRYMIIILIYVVLLLLKINNRMYSELIITSIGYLLLFYYGVLYSNINNKLLIIITIIGASLILYKYLEIGYINIQDYKYPPRSYYIYYGIVMFNILFYLKNKIEEQNLKKLMIIDFIGRSTMWIYLWHILLIYVIIYLEKKNININYKIKYIVLLCGAILLTKLQQNIVDNIFKKTNKFNKNIKEILKG